MPRRTAISLLLSLEARLQVRLDTFRAALKTDQTPESVFGDLGYYLAERLFRQESRIEELESWLFLCEKRASWLNQENERLRKEPAGERLLQAQEQMRILMGDLQRAEDELSDLQQALDAEQLSHQQETAQRDNYIAAQNHIIAQQQLRLSSLACETPDAETTGER